MKNPDAPAMDPLDAYLLTLDDQRRFRRSRGPGSLRDGNLTRSDLEELERLMRASSAAFAKVPKSDRKVAIESGAWRAFPDQYDNYDLGESLCGTPISKRAPKYWWDIETLPRAHYQIDIEWGSLEQQLARWTEDYKLDLSPDFQREHVWSLRQQIAYVEYQLKGGEVGRNIVFNHPDWNGCSDTGRLEIVDGKQRVEAVRAFMRGDVPVFGRVYREWSGSLRTIQASFKFCVVEMRTKADLLKLYLQINAGGTPHTEEELNKVRRMLDLERKASK